MGDAAGSKREHGDSRGKAAKVKKWPRFLAAALVASTACCLLPTASPAHDIYTGVRSKTGMLCCGGNDCAATTYRETGGRFEFLTREGEWIEIPVERILFLPIPGDPPSNDSHHAHLCYRPATDYDRLTGAAENVFGNIYLYCAFIPPGAT